MICPEFSLLGSVAETGSDDRHFSTLLKEICSEIWVSICLHVSHSSLSPLDLEIPVVL